MHSDNSLIKKLLEFNLPKDDYALFGSAIMFFKDLKDVGHDIDVIARGKAWEKACQIKLPEVPVSKKGFVVKPFGDDIEIFSEWFPGDWDVNRLIDDAELMEGIKVVGFDSVIKWKKLMGRPKDYEHIQMIENYQRGNVPSKL